MDWRKTLAEFLDASKGKLRDAVIWGAVALFTWALSAVRAWLDAPDDGLLMGWGSLGTPDLDPTYNVVSSAGLVLVLRFILPYILQFLLDYIPPAPFVLALSLLLGGTATAHAADIAGPERFPVYTLGEYRAAIGEQSAPLWFVGPRESASIKRVGNELAFTGPPGRYTIDLIEISYGGENKPPVTSQVSRVVEITGSAPPVPPGPEPNPPGPAPPTPVPPTPPTPVPPTPPTPPEPVPAGFLGLTKWAYDRVIAMSAVDRAQAPAVAAMLQSGASALAAGGLKSPNELLTQTANDINSRGAAWKALRSQLRDELLKQGFLNRPQGDFVQGWNALAAGVLLAK